MNTERAGSCSSGSRGCSEILLLGLLLCCPGSLRAQESEPVEEVSEEVAEEPSQPLTLQELQEMVLRQQETIEAQQEQLVSQQKALLVLQTQIDELKSGTHEASPEEIALKERLQELESKMQAQSEDVAEIDEEFPGSINIPGTNMAFRAGGFVNLTMVSSFDPIDPGDRFTTSGIAVTEDDRGEPGTEIIVNRSRLNFDWRMKSRFGQFRSFIEGDFRGDNEVLRLRHAFGQFRNLTLGQTWTTFMDTQNRPEEIDLEGLNGQVQLRQALGRFDLQAEGLLRWSFALEDPVPEITDGIGETRLPDLVARALWERRQNRAHVAFLLRHLVGKSEILGTEEESDVGFGLSSGTRVPATRWDERDHLMLQGTVGRGIGRYIADLRAQGGQDAVFDPETGELIALGVVAGFASFQHWWAESIRSTFSLGWTYVDNEDFQEDDAYHQTFRATANAIWSPIANIDLGVETLYGVRKNKGGEEGTALQLQLASYFRF